jgi:hypothetical protein
MKPYGLTRNIKGSGVWKNDHRIIQKNRKVGNWWEDMVDINKKTERQKGKKESLDFQ